MWGDSLTAQSAPYMNFYSSYDVVNLGVGGETSTQTLARVQALPEAWKLPTIIWTGRNDGQVASAETNIAAIVAKLTHTNYIVLGLLNTSAETIGTGGYNIITQINSDLAATYGSKFFDMRTYLVAQYNPGIPQDVTDHSNDITPSSLRVDTVHLNVAGYSLAAQQLLAHFA